MFRAIFNANNVKLLVSCQSACNKVYRLPLKLPCGQPHITCRSANKVFTKLYCSIASENEDTTPLTDEEISTLTNKDPELEQKLKIIILETEVLRQDGHTIPSNEFMKLEHWEELLKLTTRSARRKYLSYLFKLEKKKENDVIKKERKRIEREERKLQDGEEVDDGSIKYGLNHNCMMLRVYDTTINTLYNNNLIKAMQFGQKLVLDCGYSDKMSTRENVNCAKQLTLLFGENRIDREAFDIHFCNAQPKSQLMKALLRNIPTMHDTHFPFNLHEKSYLDLFPKEKLIYLTPHCREEMLEYDHDAIYIIGGIVDKINNEPLSMAKAKEEGIRMTKLPLDRYLSWGAGAGKSLTLNQMILILLDIKKTGDWKYSLRHVPQRKLIPEKNYGKAIKSYRGLSYDVEKPKGVKVPLYQVSSSGWVPKKKPEKPDKFRKVKISNILKE